MKPHTALHARCTHSAIQNPKSKIRILSAPSTLHLLLKWLVPTVLVEAFLLRFFIRTGPLFPSGPATEALFAGALWAGIAAMNLAYLISTLALVSLGLALARRRDAPGPLLLAVVGTGVVLAFTPSSGATALVYSTVSLFAFAALARPAMKRPGSNPQSAIAFALLLAYGSAHGYRLFQAASLLGITIPYGAGIYSIGEVFAVAAAVALLVPYLRPFSPRSAVAATGAALIFTGFALKVSIAPLVARWAVEFTFHLPLPAYAVAVWCFTYALVRLLLEKEWRTAGGLLLIAASGRGLPTTYLNQAAMLGLWMALTSRPRPPRAPADKTR